jgi:flagellar FliL protein
MRFSPKFIALLSMLTFGLSIALPSQANTGGGEAKEGVVPFTKLDPFTINLVGMQHVLQIVVTLKSTKPGVGAKIKAYMPIIRHNLILLFSSKADTDINTTEGKQMLMDDVMDEVNRVIHLDDKKGVVDTFFESFIIQ